MSALKALDVQRFAYSLLLASNTFYWTVRILQCALESAVLESGLQSHRCVESVSIGENFGLAVILEVFVNPSWVYGE